MFSTIRTSHMMRKRKSLLCVKEATQLRNQCARITLAVALKDDAHKATLQNVSIG